MKAACVNSVQDEQLPINRRQAIAGAAAYLAALFRPKSEQAEWELVQKIEVALEDSLPEEPLRLS
jgi:hypothetical protein